MKGHLKLRLQFFNINVYFKAEKLQAQLQFLKAQGLNLMNPEDDFTADTETESGANSEYDGYLKIFRKNYFRVNLKSYVGSNFSFSYIPAKM